MKSSCTDRLRTEQYNPEDKNAPINDDSANNDDECTPARAWCKVGRKIKSRKSDLLMTPNRKYRMIVSVNNARKTMATPYSSQLEKPTVLINAIILTL